MHPTRTGPAPTTNPALYDELNTGLAALVDGERDFIANAANAAALMFHTIPDVNWAGFYILRGNELVVGPFQGKPACVRIALGRGVCGTAAATRRTVIVPNVHEFAGHIACDAASNSEIVVPMLIGDRLIGVLDIDSASFNRFDEADAEGLRETVSVLLGASDVRE
ncbi:MAG TPA: GAF domain-containing protein [Urbifossiella sp.]|jgi:GAF domain-containing protein|nr:GAF domain-containing protein [Urbifossiella sp.]